MRKPCGGGLASLNSAHRHKEAHARQGVYPGREEGGGRGAHLWLPVDLDAEEAAAERVDDDEDVAEVGRDDAAPVVAPVLRPHHLHLVVAEVTQLTTTHAHTRYQGDAAGNTQRPGRR